MITIKNITLSTVNGPVSLDSKFDVVIPEYVFDMLIKEIMSKENREGTQLNFRVHEPTLDQLIYQYKATGAIQRFFNRNGDLMGIRAHV